MKKNFKNSVMVLSVALLVSCGGNQDKSSTVSDVEYENVDIDDTFVVDTIVDESSVIEAGSTSGTNDENASIDKMLDDYESMINDLDRYVTKLNAGEVDMESAMSMTSKAESIQNNLEAQEKQMSTKQLQRLHKLVAKQATISAKAANVNVNNIKSVGGVDLKDLGL